MVNAGSAVKVYSFTCIQDNDTLAHRIKSRGIDEGKRN